MSTLSSPLDIVLRAIREERNFRKDFSTAADSIVDKVYSYYTNPNCSCKATIVTWINENVDVVNSLLTKHADAITAMSGDVAKAAELAKVSEAPKGAKAGPTTPPARPSLVDMLKNPNSRMGHVIDIDRDPDAYKALIEKAVTEQWIYRGVNVVPDIVDGKAVWSVFFF